MQKDVWLHRRQQRVTIVVNRYVKTAFSRVVTEFGTVVTVDKDQPYRIDVKRQRISLSRAYLGRTKNEVRVEHPVKRRVFPVFMFARRQAQTQHLLKMMLRVLRTIFSLSLKQAVPLLQRLTVVR